MSNLKTIDQLPDFTGSLDTAYTLIRKDGITYKVLASTLTGGGGGGAATSIGGSPITTASLQAGDVLIYTGTEWNNSNKTTLVDGGNF